MDLYTKKWGPEAGQGPHEPPGRAWGGGRRALVPRGAHRAPFDLIPALQIPEKSETLRGVHEMLFPSLQALVLERSHLGSFSGNLPEGESITEGIYIPMMRE